MNPLVIPPGAPVMAFCHRPTPLGASSTSAQIGANVGAMGATFSTAAPLRAGDAISVVVRGERFEVAALPEGAPDQTVLEEMVARLGNNVKARFPTLSVERFSGTPPQGGIRAIASLGFSEPYIVPAREPDVGLLERARSTEAGESPPQRDVALVMRCLQLTRFWGQPVSADFPGRRQLSVPFHGARGQLTVLTEAHPSSDAHGPALPWAMVNVYLDGQRAAYRNLGAPWDLEDRHPAIALEYLACLTPDEVRV